MSKEITKANIIQEIQDRFKLRELEPEIFSFSERVIPVYSIEPHIEYPVTRYINKSITSGPTGYWLLTVPYAERWYLMRYNIVFMAAGAYTVTGLYIERKSELNPDSFIYLDMTLGQTASYLIDLPKPVRLDPGDTVSVYIDGYTSTADLRIYLDYVREEIR